MAKDWSGSKVSLFKMLGASNHTEDEREEFDYYATDPNAINELLEYEKFGENIWECCVGGGHLAKRLNELGYKVKCSDIIDRGYAGTEIIDFLKAEPKIVEGGEIDIITNPPYKYCSEFILKALETINDGRKVAMFLKLTTLESQKRYDEIFSKYPPQTIYVFVKRIECAKNGDFDKYSGSAVCYAWFVWEKGNYNETKIKWVNYDKGKQVEKFKLF